MGEPLMSLFLLCCTWRLLPLGNGSYCCTASGPNPRLLPAALAALEPQVCRVTNEHSKREDVSQAEESVPGDRRALVIIMSQVPFSHICLYYGRVSVLPVISKLDFLLLSWTINRVLLRNIQLLKVRVQQNLCIRTWCCNHSGVGRRQFPEETITDFNLIYIRL